MDAPMIVSGAVSTVSELGKDEAWLGGWLREQPARLGLGELEVVDGAEPDDRSFVAIADDRCFSVDVQLGELEASRGFGVLDNWARNRVRHPDKTHVAVLVTEQVDDRYQTTLQTLAEHLPLVVIELQVWRGENEAIVVPHVALSSHAVDLSGTPAAKAAQAVAKGVAAEGQGEAASSEGEEPVAGEQEDETGEADGDDAGDGEPENAVPENKDDTGVADPWGLPPKEPEASESDGDGSGHRLLHKVGS